MYHLSPSILAADFAALGDNIKTAVEAGVDYIHIDVMDGIFVPSISFGMPVISSVRKVTDAVFDVHLMIENPERYIKDFALAGADIITVHAEACTHLDRVVSLIKEQGKKAGVSINPATPISVLEHVLEDVDMLLIMSVNPGFGGQKFIPYTLEKVRKLRAELDKRGLNIDIEVDGGVNIENVSEVMKAGANIIVAGSAVFGGDIAANINDFLEIFKSRQ
jgi:ribulose-phosphate 3-epimerase